MHLNAYRLVINNMTVTRNIKAEELREAMRQDILSVLGKDVKGDTFEGAYGKRIEGNLRYGVTFTESEELGIKPKEIGIESHPKYNIEITTDTPLRTISPKAKVTTNISVSSLEGKDYYVGKIIEAWQELLGIKRLLKDDWRHISKIQDAVREIGDSAISQTKLHMDQRTYKINTVGFNPSMEIIGFIDGDAGVKAFVKDFKKKEDRKLLQKVLSAQAEKIERD